MDKKAKSCPIAVTDVALNTKNRDIAIEEWDYGPMNPDEPNEKFWRGIGKLWKITPEQAKASRCGNCAAFIQTKDMLECIQDHLGLDDDYTSTPQGLLAMERHRARPMQAAGLGYCQLFAFKCAADRVCRAWVHGGPIR